MILFPDDIQAINDLLSQRADLDPELLAACQDHINHAQYPDAIFKAFRLLEGRIQHRSGVQGETAGRLLNEALATRGPLTQKLGLTSQQAANFRDLLKGAFAVFRNPEAHPGEAIFDYGSAECQAVLAFVNLMLSVLDRKPETPLDAALKQIRANIGSDETVRLNKFLQQVGSFNLQVQEGAGSFSYRAWTLRATRPGAQPKKTRTTVFLLCHGTSDPNLYFTAAHQWRRIVGFDPEPHANRLKALGCSEVKGSADLFLDLRSCNSTATFDRIFAIVRDIVHAMEATVTAHQENTP